MIRRLGFVSFVVLGCSSSTPEPVAAPVDSARPAIDARDSGVVVDGGGPSPIDSSAPDTFVVDSAVVDTFVLDSAPALDTKETSPAGGYDCTGSDFGPSHPETFVSFFNQVQVAVCPSSACSDFMELNDCKLRLQVKDVGTEVTMEAIDCLAFKRWLTSELLVSKLRDTVTCFGDKGDGPYESIEVTLIDGPAKKKTASCAVEPFVSHRACLKGLREKYFPGK